MVDKMTNESKNTQILNAKASADQEVVADAVKKASKGKVTIFCGIPMGLKLNLKGGDFILNGVPMSHVVSAIKGQGFLPAGKFGMTPATAEIWDEIFAKYGKCDFIENGTVFAKADMDEGQEIAKEKSGSKFEKNLGFDQADPKKSKKTKKASKED
jgi:hypothetical protein